MFGMILGYSLVSLYIICCCLLAYWKAIQVLRKEEEVLMAILFLISCLFPPLGIVIFCVEADFFYDYIKRTSKIRQKKKERKKHLKAYPHLKILELMKTTAKRYQPILTIKAIEKLEETLKQLEMNHKEPLVKEMLQESEESFAYAMSLFENEVGLFDFSQNKTRNKVDELFETFILVAQNVLIQVRDEELKKRQKEYKVIKTKFQKKQQRVNEDLEQYLEYYERKRNA